MRSGFFWDWFYWTLSAFDESNFGWNCSHLHLSLGVLGISYLFISAVVKHYSSRALINIFSTPESPGLGEHSWKCKLQIAKCGVRNGWRYWSLISCSGGFKQCAGCGSVVRQIALCGHVGTHPFALVGR